jgi:hypothetical protein
MKTKTKVILVRSAGAISIVFTLFHAGFYWLFNWAQTLNVMNHTDRSIFLTFSLLCTLLIFYSVIVAFFYTKDLFETATGKSLSLFFSFFYLMRIVSEFTYFRFSMPGSVIIIALCLLPAICFGLPVLLKTKKKE